MWFTRTLTLNKKKDSVLLNQKFGKRFEISNDPNILYYQLAY